MSKLIKVTQECLDSIRKDFEDALSSGKFSDGKVTFTKTIGSVNRKATVFFTEIAWLKMQTLISEFDKEVAWHGIAKRGEDPAKDEYIISDILVYPQEVTGATVTTDQQKYQMWLMGHEDDVFNNIRFQGHSHVNMGTTPSSVDTALYDGILDQLTDKMFYIFMIWNKRKEKTIKIYDMAKNVLFETADVDVKIMNDGSGIEQWLKDAKDMVKDRVYTPTPTYGGYGNYGYGGYGSGYGGYGSHSATNATGKKDEPQQGKSSGKKKKGKRKGKKYSSGFNNACDEDEISQMTIFHGYDDDEDDYNDPFFSREY